MDYDVNNSYLDRRCVFARLMRFGGKRTELVAGGPIAATAAGPSLAESQLQPVVEAAIANWTTAGASSQVLAAMASVQIEIKPLPQGELGVEYPGVIYLDPKAQGYGWFVDPTPAQNDEFTQLGSTGELQAVDPQAVDRIDLLTVVEHELGHVAGLGDLAPSATSLMSSTLAPGIRREPGPVEIDAILAEPGT